MKITYLHQYFTTPSMSNGGGTRSYELAKFLVKKGHEVNMITTYRTPSKKEKNWIKSDVEGIKVHWLPLPYSNQMSYNQRIKQFIIFAYKATLKASNIKTDLIFATSTPLTISIPGIFASFKNKVPMVFEVRDLWPKIPIALKIIKNPFLKLVLNSFEKFIYNYATSIIALSPDMKNGIIEKKIKKEKIAVIPNISNLNNYQYDNKIEKYFRKKRPWLKNYPVLIYAGTFGKINNLEYAVLLAEQLKKQNSKIKILLVGDGMERKNLISIAKRKKVLNFNLFFENPVTKNEIISYFLSSTICANFVLDLKEAWANSANKFFDSLAAGKPIFLNHGGWMKDLVTSNKCGVCMYGKSLELVARELEKFLNDKKWIKENGKNAKLLANRFFSHNLLLNQFEQVLVSAKKNKPNKSEKISPGYYY